VELNPIHFFDRRLETLDRARLRQLQEEKLRRLMASLRTNVFYAEKLGARGLDPGDVRTLQDLARLPFTTKSELVESQSRQPPFGTLPTYPLGRYRHLHQTSGTSGQPLRWLDTEEDWETWVRCWACVYRGAGVTDDDVVFGAFSFGPYVSHWAAMAGAERVGALGLAGGGMSSLQRLQSMLANRVTVLACTPTYALHLAEVASRHGIDLRSSPVRITIHAGEPGASVPNVKRRIEEAWNARCFDHAGATEVGGWAFDCQARNEAIHLNELEFAFEVIEPEGERPVPDERRGELVVTTLGRPGMPVIRYRTGDLVVRGSAPCACGRTLATIRGGVLGRADDMMIVRGINLYPAAMDDVIRGVPGIAEYEVEVRRTSALDDVVVKVEPGDGRRFPDLERALRQGFRDRFNLRVTVEEAPPDSLPRYELKARRYKRC
jgi:phenylacetate-CoA ligase